ncbi:MAG: hypothetical protein GOMPHAMPRED_007827 [Gomphillus americanus]|uniref:Uncharacterized protein n=1 Tax=Gomphillus americanus TaxID=1940652 RepID=A0A8H3ETK2_9LECA|nr:MAG: hypothetical protein GOMPHAMPRED_007827 [Gomphillus americanus]
MAPINDNSHMVWLEKRAHGKSAIPVAGLILEAWGEGFQVGSLVILILIVLCNYKRRILLHKLILIEMVLALFHGTFIFLDDPSYGWYLSATATLLFISYQVHNYVSYLKIQAFMPRWGRWTYLISLAIVQPYWIVEAWDNFEYFNMDSNLNVYTRPWEALARDPWWIFTTVFLFYKIKVGYEFTVRNLFKASPRFGIMTICMVFSIAFLLADVIVTAASLTLDAGINPWWRLALVFKCASDTIFLDDFKSVLDAIISKRFRRFRSDGQAELEHSSGPHASRKRSASAAGAHVISSLWKNPKHNKPVSEHIELGNQQREGSSDAILQELPSFPHATVTFERKIAHEEDAAWKDKPSYNCSVSANRG